MDGTILITGGGGYIGSHVGFYLYQKGYDVLILDNFSTTAPINFDWAKIIRGDCSDCYVLDSIFENYKIDAVMHFAAFSVVSDSMSNPAAYYENNVAKTISLLNSMKKHGVSKLIFSSTAAVYGIPEHLPITENHPKNPVSVYGRTKLMMENIIQDYSDIYDLRFVALRYFNAAGAVPEFGLGERHNPETHIIPIVLDSAKTGKPFNVFGINYETKDGTCVRDYLHVIDIADAHWRAYLHLKDDKPSDIFNLGTSSGLTVKEIINSAEKITGVKINTLEKSPRWGDPSTLIADASKAKNILGWEPKFSDIDFIIKSAFVFHNKFDLRQRQADVL